MARENAARTDQPSASPPARGLLVVSVAVILALCLASLAAMVFGQAWLPQARLPLGYSIIACVSDGPGPGLEWTVGWLLPELRSSTLPPGPGCAYLPWLPILPPTGHYSLRFPP